MILITIALLLVPAVVNAQGPNPDLKTMLQDASYILNRFQEEAIGLNVDIDNWNLSTKDKDLFKRELAMIGADVAEEKPNLIRLLGQDRVSATDLFDVYSGINEVSSELFGQASNAANWSPNSANGVRLAQLGGKAQALGANLGATLRQKIQEQENRLSTCKCGL